MRCLSVYSLENHEQKANRRRSAGEPAIFATPGVVGTSSQLSPKPGSAVDPLDVPNRSRAFCATNPVWITGPTSEKNEPKCSPLGMSGFSAFFQSRFAADAVLRNEAKVCTSPIVFKNKPNLGAIPYRTPSAVDNGTLGPP